MSTSTEFAPEGSPDDGTKKIVEIFTKFLDPSFTAHTEGSPEETEDELRNRIAVSNKIHYLSKEVWHKLRDEIGSEFGIIQPLHNLSVHTIRPGIWRIFWTWGLLNLCRELTHEESVCLANKLQNL